VMDELLNLAVIEEGEEGVFPVDVQDIENMGKVSLYQVCGVVGRGEAIVKYLGVSKDRPVIKIHGFGFKGCECEIVSYLLSDVDMKLVDDRCTMKMLGLIIKRDGGVVGAITYSFYTFVHRRDKRSITEYIDKNVVGFFGYEFRFVDKGGVVREERIGVLNEVFPGRTKCVYGLVEFLSDEKLSFLFV